MKGGNEKSLDHLLKLHKLSIEALRKEVETQLPDVAKLPKSSLEDGTKLDEIFYLRYILSLKGNVTPETINKATSSVVKHLQWRKGRIMNHIGWSKGDFSTVDSKWLRKIPMYKTGNLPNHFPVAVLPVAKVAFEYLFSGCQDGKRGEMEDEVLDFMLVQKEKIFRELDSLTRETKMLVKSVVVYDLSGMSFGSIYKLTKFFKLVQQQGKIFKEYFPQSTHSTVLLNAPGSWVLKLFSGSSKQKVQTIGEFLNEYKAKNAVPKFLGGTAAWPDTEEKMILSSKPVVKRRNERADSEPREENLFFNSDGLPSLKFNKVNLTLLERELVYMKKNKVFSIDVLDAKQTVDICFVNKRKKPANVLVAVRSGTKEYSVVSNCSVRHQGLKHIRLNVEKPGEVLLVYVSRNEAKQQSVDSLKLNPSYRQKLSNAVTLRQPSSFNPAKYDENKHQKLFFSFHVTRSIQAGLFMGDRDVGEINIPNRSAKAIQSGLSQFDAFSEVQKPTSVLSFLWS